MQGDLHNYKIHRPTYMFYSCSELDGFNIPHKQFICYNVLGILNWDCILRFTKQCATCSIDSCCCYSQTRYYNYSVVHIIPGCGAWRQSYHSPLQLNTYVICVRPLQICNFFQCRDRLYMSESDVIRRQIVTSKVARIGRVIVN